jgi:hypothetical protein
VREGALNRHGKGSNLHGNAYANRCGASAAVLDNANSMSKEGIGL